MTRRRFYAPPEAFATDRTSGSLSADETRHLRSVLRLQTGDEVYVFDGAGREFRAEIDAINRDQTKLRITEEVVPSALESPLTLTMAVALLKGEKFDLVIQKLTELGVSRVVPLITARADVRLRNDHEADGKVSRWQRIAMEATKQCGRARLMTIENPLAFDQLMESSKANGELRFMFAERGGDSFAHALDQTQKAAAQITALVGPEGGWSDDELSQALNEGWQLITLGGRIMRAETSAIACAALLQHRLGDLN